LVDSHETFSGRALRCYAGAVPARVLDPFAGAGTVAVVAATLNRESTNIELNSAYVEIMQARLQATHGP